tara:strand:+ start:90 stop:230 length:141 start_codon:yes stop_codon:yes gene_type:complete
MKEYDYSCLTLFRSSGPFTEIKFVLASLEMAYKKGMRERNSEKEED